MKDNFQLLDTINESFLNSLYEYRSGKLKDTSFFKKYRRQKARILSKIAKGDVQHES